MVRTCVFCGAGDLSELGEGLTHHGFALKDAEYLHRWLQNMGLGPNFVPSKNALLCSIILKKLSKKALLKTAFTLQAFLLYLDNINVRVFSVTLYSFAEEERRKKYCDNGVDDIK